MGYVYKFLDCYNDILYIGKTSNLKSRIYQHFAGNGHLKEKCYIDCVKVEYLEIENMIDVDMVEIFLINKYKPMYNKASNYESLYSVEFNVKENWKNYSFDLIKGKYEFLKFKKEMLNNVMKELIDLKKEQESINFKIKSIEEKIKKEFSSNVDISNNYDNEEYLEFVEILNKLNKLINSSVDLDDCIKQNSSFNVFIDIKNIWNIISESSNLERNTFLKMCKKYQIFKGKSDDYYKSIRLNSKRLTKCYMVDLVNLKNMIL